MPFSYLFISLTQECDPRVKYISDLFCNIHVYIPNGNTFEKINVVGNYSNIMINNPNSTRPHSTFSQNVGVIHYGYPMNIKSTSNFQPYNA